MEVICIDSSILIEFWRAIPIEKPITLLMKLSDTYSLAVSSVVVYEILKGNKSKADIFWNKFFSQIKILDFVLVPAQEASRIYHQLKSSGKIIGVKDILKAFAAVQHNLPLATANKKHLENIDKLRLIEIEKIK